MRIISFATADSDWKSPRMGIVLHTNGRDSGDRLDCEKLFEPSERPANPLDWFDMDGRWFERARDTAVRLERDARALDDAREKGWQSGLAVPKTPVIFSKFSSCVIAPGEPVVIPPSSEKVDYEAELAVVIGRRASRVTAKRAYHHILGYTAFNDVTARDFQVGDGQWQRGKSCDTFAPMGQSIVTTDEIPDPHALRITMTLNGRRDAGFQYESADLKWTSSTSGGSGIRSKRACSEV
jgi:hypothetical protein